MPEFVEPTHPEVGTIRCTRAAYESVYKAKGFRLRGAPRPDPKPALDEGDSKRKAPVPADTTTDDKKEQ